MEKLLSKKEVIAIIDDLLQRPDILIDAVQNENTDWDAEKLYELGLSGALANADTGDRQLTIPDVMIELPDYELNFCEKCFQMTNHLDGICQKCKDN